MAQLIEFSDLARKHRRPVTGVIHVGAHLGEEAEIYAAQGVTDVVWVEGNPDLIAQLTENVARYGHIVIAGLVSETDDTPVEFNIANNGYSSSLLELGTHTTAHPDVFFTETKHLVAHRLDTLLERAGVDLSRFNYLCMDLQGAELMCLRGAPNALGVVDYVYTEINEDELYVGCARIPDLDAFLAAFDRVETEMAEGKGWGEALYVRRGVDTRPRWFDRIRGRRR